MSCKQEAKLDNSVSLLKSNCSHSSALNLSIMNTIYMFKQFGCLWCFFSSHFLHRWSGSQLQRLPGAIEWKKCGGRAAEGLNGIYIIFVLSPFSINPPFCQLREFGWSVSKNFTQWIFIWRQLGAKNFTLSDRNLSQPARVGKKKAQGNQI